MDLSITPRIKMKLVLIRLSHTVVLLMLTAVLSAQVYVPYKSGGKFVLKDAGGAHHTGFAEYSFIRFTNNCNAFIGYHTDTDGKALTSLIMYNYPYISSANYHEYIVLEKLIFAIERKSVSGRKTDRIHLYNKTGKLLSDDFFSQVNVRMDAKNFDKRTRDILIETRDENNKLSLLVYDVVAEKLKEPLLAGLSNVQVDTTNTMSNKELYLFQPAKTGETLYTVKIVDSHFRVEKSRIPPRLTDMEDERSFPRDYSEGRRRANDDGYVYEIRVMKDLQRGCDSIRFEEKIPLPEIYKVITYNGKKGLASRYEETVFIPPVYDEIYCTRVSENNSVDFVTKFENQYGVYFVDQYKTYYSSEPLFKHIPIVERLFCFNSLAGYVFMMFDESGRFIGYSNQKGEIYQK